MIEQVIVKDQIKGYVSFKKWDDHGQLVDAGKFTNLVTSISRRSIGNRLRSHPLASGVRALAIGTGSAVPTIGDTTLASEIYRQAIPAAGIDLPWSRNIISPPPGVVMVTFAATLTPFGSGTGTVAPGGVGASFFVGEFGLFADVVAIADPTVIATLAPHSPAAGSVNNNDYAVKYTYENDNGETLPSTTSTTLTLAGQGGFDITLPAAPAQAQRVKIYIKTGAGNYIYHDVITDPLITVYSVNTQPDSNPLSAQPPLANSSNIPGKTGSGTLVNRAIFPSPQQMLTGFQIGIENSLVLG